MLFVSLSALILHCEQSPFVTNACGRLVIVQLLSQCVSIEQMVQERENEAAA